MKTALLIIDVQNDYFPGGKMELNGSLNASDKIRSLMEHFRNRSMPVIHIQHISTRPGASFFIPDTPGAEFHDNVKPSDGEKIFTKNYPNSFRNTGLHEYLTQNNITGLVIAGMMTHMCVDTTVRYAFDYGYNCTVAGDCCATKSLGFDNYNVSAADVQYSYLAALHGTFATVLKKDDIIDLFPRV